MADMRKRFVIGNWKLNGELGANAVLLDKISLGVGTTTGGDQGKCCGVCVPSVYLPQVQRHLAKGLVGWGAQDVSRFVSGAYTGEVSAKMVAEFGCRYTIVGHSERRVVFGDADAAVAEKFGNAKNAGLAPILCVGETLDERIAGHTEIVIMRQLHAITDTFGVEGLDGVILAYEPVWAIGTGKTASPAEADAVHAFLRAEIGKLDLKIAADIPILYGGSVKKSNAKELFAMPNIDGGLIGGASLVAEEFLGIWHAL